jgi:ATP-dependent DNA helicase RecG
MPSLSDNIQYVTGVGPKRAELFAKHLQIATVEDMLYFFPFKYLDRSVFTNVSDISIESTYVQLKGRIVEYQTIGEKRGKRLVGKFADQTGFIELVWFKGFSWIPKSVPLNTTIIVLGKPTVFNRTFNIAHPEIELLSVYENSLVKGLQPQYSIPEKLKQHQVNSKTIKKIQQTILTHYSAYISDPLPEEIIQRNRLLPLKEALYQIHFPENNETVRKAEYRLKFEELFYVQINILNLRQFRKKNISGYVLLREKDNHTKLLYKKLPFKLTKAQIKVLSEIRKDVISGKQMNRLLQGDVGSGKTIVALIAMLMAVDNGYQACLMAPTEILAQQHLASLTELCSGIDIGISLLTGSTKTRERKDIHERLMNGKIHILIGTHALIEDTVQFANLGMVVIDEQHRFGVAQRSKLWQKNTKEPHILVMTATPIPRTLSMTVYGDLDVSVINELPPGRIPIKTVHLMDNKRLTLFSFIKDQISKGRQVYVVFPLIKESENFTYKDLEDGYESYSREFPPPEYFISVVHGQMKSQEKEISMNYFVKGKAQIMIATTVIEVGVDVPNASVMVLESAERFGLAQLHQLRGRVGRGNEQSYCVLMTSHQLSKIARQRIAIMCESNDGFYIAEMDMKLRGPGDIEGTMQSGMPFDFKIANLVTDELILTKARDEAEFILEKDFTLKTFPSLLNKLKKLKTQKIDWSKIS